MKKIMILMLAVVFGMTAMGQSSKTATTTTIQKVVIQTNGVCEKCEALFKDNVPFFKGVKDYEYDAKTSKMTITYDSKKTSPDQLRQQISKLGYNADNIKADPAARAKLPACCQVDKKPSQSGSCGGCGHNHGNGGCGGCGHNHGNGNANHSNCTNHGEHK